MVELKTNVLYYGDNLDILREHIPHETIDLVYLDPPFNSNRSYNVLFRESGGASSGAQIEAFEDTWQWGPTAQGAYEEVVTGPHQRVARMLQAMVESLGHNDVTAYLSMMAVRMVELHRVLKPTGSLYLHCDPTAGPYLRVLMDSVFGPKNFMNEIIWERFNFHADAHRWGRLHDVLLHYVKDAKHYTFRPQRRDYDEGYIRSHFKQDAEGRLYRLDNAVAKGQGPPRTFFGKLMEPPKGTHWRWSQENIDRLSTEGRIVLTSNGRPTVIRYLDEMPGHAIGDVWTDIPEINSQAKERLGYPTQKPIALLMRIIEASSNPGDVVFDPFAGCGTTIYAAHLTGRKWIGCDIAILSVQLVRDVLLKRYGLKEGEHYQISGVPRSLEAAQVLFESDPRQFQHWAVELAGGFSSTKHSGDLGIDGRIHFETKDGLRNMVLSVKGGKLTPAFMRELRGVVERELDTEMGGMICLQEPTKGMRAEAANAGVYAFLGKEYHRLQIRTIQDLLEGKAFDTPSRVQTLNWTKQTVMAL